MTDGTTVAAPIGAGGGIPTGRLRIEVLWDISGFTAVYGATSTFTPVNGGSAWVEYVAATGAVTALPTNLNEACDLRGRRDASPASPILFSGRVGTDDETNDDLGFTLIELVMIIVLRALWR
jgi:hypothetical protein